MGKAFQPERIKAESPRIKMMLSRRIKERHEEEQYERKDGGWQEEFM